MNYKTILLIASLIISTRQIVAAADEHDHNHSTDAKPAEAHGKSDGHVEAHSDEVKLTSEAIRSNGIRIAKATRQPLVGSIVAPARVSFNLESMAHVGSVVKGRVIDIKVRVGDSVEKGQELLLVESPELGQAQSDYLRKKQALAVSELSVEPTKMAYERSRKLFDESQSIALSEVQKRDVEYRSAQANVMTAKAELLAAENTLHLLGIAQADLTKLADTGEINPRFAIRAPIAGKVIDREVTLGELVSPEKEKLLMLADTSNYWVLADVPEGRLSDVGVGSRARIEVAAVKNEAFEGVVSLVSATVDAQTRSAQLRIEVKNGHTTLRPGMFAKATIWSNVGGEAESFIVIPEEAVQTVEGTPSVFVPVPDEANTFKHISVKVGKSIGGMVPVYEGLDTDNELVVSGSFILKAELGKNEAAHEH